MFVEIQGLCLKHLASWASLDLAGEAYLGMILAQITQGNSLGGRPSARDRGGAYLCLADVGSPVIGRTMERGAFISENMRHIPHFIHCTKI
jgi:hypothetical protein